MTDHCLIPVIVGVGDIVNKSNKVEDAVEPLQLMVQAVLSAVNDTGLTSSRAQNFRSSIDSIDVVASWTWSYQDLPGLLARELGIQPTWKNYSKHGGHQPIKLVDEAARRISRGSSSVAVVTGGEALASLSACKTAKTLPPPDWTTPNGSSESISSLGLGQYGGSLGALHAMDSPTQIYALYENAFRAHRGQSIDQNNLESAKLYAEFGKIAKRNPFAWSHGQPAPSESVISTVSKHNRMICFPYPLLMNAFNNVNQAAACVLTSTEYAEELGIPENKWIYPLGGAGTQEADNFWERRNFYSSPSISRSLNACLDIAGLTKEQIDIFDFYSCFPIVPKLACESLGLPVLGPRKPISLLGGLTSFGGAGNNYSMHSLTAIVRRLRAGDGRSGLILANGGVLTNQHALCLSIQPKAPAYPILNPLSEYVMDQPVPSIVSQAKGEATIETYTVEFDREGASAKGFVIGRLRMDQSKRFVANAGNQRTLQQLASRTKEPIGSTGWVETGADGRNMFLFDQNANL